MIGTILPTHESIAATNRWAKDRDRAAIAQESALFVGMTLRTVGGERRYYSPCGGRYAILGRDGTTKRFVVRHDGDYPEK